MLRGTRAVSWHGEAAWLVSTGHGENTAGDRPVKTLGIRARHSRRVDIFISDSRLLLPLAAPGRRLAWELGLARCGLSLLRSPAAGGSTGRAGPFLIRAPTFLRNAALSAPVSLGYFFPFHLALPAGPLILQQLKHGVIFQAEFGLGREVLMEPGGMDLSKTIQTQSPKSPEMVSSHLLGSGEDDSPPAIGPAALGRPEIKENLFFKVSWLCPSQLSKVTVEAQSDFCRDWSSAACLLGAGISWLDPCNSSSQVSFTLQSHILLLISLYHSGMLQTVP